MHARRPLALLAGLLLVVSGLVGCTSSGSEQAANPHTEHVNLPAFSTWRVTSVQPYEGLKEIELVKFDWPTKEDAHLAFALTSEGLKVGDAICLDHVREVDTFWAHPMPPGGCAALGVATPSTPTP